MYDIKGKGRRGGEAGGMRGRGKEGREREGVEGKRRGGGREGETTVMYVAYKAENIYLDFTKIDI